MKKECFFGKKTLSFFKSLFYKITSRNVLEGLIFFMIVFSMDFDSFTVRVDVKNMTGFQLSDVFFVIFSGTGVLEVKYFDDFWEFF